MLFTSTHLFVNFHTFSSQMCSARCDRYRFFAVWSKCDLIIFDRCKYRLWEWASICGVGLIFIVAFLVNVNGVLFIFTSNQSAIASDEQRNMICILNNELNYCLILVHETTSNHQQTHTHMHRHRHRLTHTHTQPFKALKCGWESGQAGDRVCVCAFARAHIMLS